MIATADNSVSEWVTKPDKVARKLSLGRNSSAPEKAYFCEPLRLSLVSAVLVAKPSKLE